MKKILYFLLGLSSLVLIVACDVNDKFDGLDDMANPTNLTKYNYTLTDADYKTISDRALKLATNAQDSAKANSINSNKAFSVFAPASNYVHLLLNTKYPYADILSASSITYAYGQTSISFNILNVEDYQKAWNNTFFYVEALTASTAPDLKMNLVLKNKFPNAKTGDYKFIEYNYSSVEASINYVDYKYFFDNFESYTFNTSSPYTPITEGGWVQKDTVTGTSKGKYYGRVYSGNKYAQVTSNGTSEKNNIFLITKQIDLTQAINPKFTFDVTVGYWNATCLQVFISDNFSGNVANIGSANWTEITSNFTLPVTPTSGYGTLSPAGEADLTAYVGKKVYIAFKYSGDSRAETTPKVTTTYQIDNVKVSEMRDALSVPSSEKQYLAYSFDGDNWVKQASEVFYILQSSDYSEMGLPNYLVSSDLSNYIPIFLKNKYPYAQDGLSKNLVYTTNSGSTNITRFIFTAGAWVTNTFRTTKTEQFVYTIDGWVFDPTISLEMTALDYQIMVDYIANPSNGLTNFADVPNNSEFYYGFSRKYSNVSFRLSYRNSYLQYDTELAALTSDVEKVNLLWDRLEDGMTIFLKLRFPNAIPQVSGVDVYYNIKVKIYTPDGLNTSVTDTYIYKYKCTAAGVPPTFEFVSKTKL